MKKWLQIILFVALVVVTVIFGKNEPVSEMRLASG